MNLTKMLLLQTPAKNEFLQSLFLANLFVL